MENIAGSEAESVLTRPSIINLGLDLGCLHGSRRWSRGYRL
jgi:hypothetical protein